MNKLKKARHKDKHNSTSVKDKCGASAKNEAAEMRWLVGSVEGRKQVKMLYKTRRL
jgi:hypothetical protein